MAETAESVIVDLYANVDQFDGKVKQSASSFGTAMKQIEASAKGGETAIDALTKAQAAGQPITAKMIRDAGGLAAAQKALSASLKETASASQVAVAGLENVHKSSGNSRIAMLEMQHVVRGSVDQFAAGTPIMQIFSQHLAQLAQAGSFAGDSLGAFGTFLSGGWGIAITAGVTILGTLGAKLLSTGDSVEGLVEKLKDEEQKTERTNDANKAFGFTIEGVTKALRENQQVLDDLANSHETAATAALHQAQAEAALLGILLGQLKAGLEARKAEQEAIANPLTGAAQEALAPGAGGEARRVAQQRIDDINKQIATANDQLNIVKQQLAVAQSLVVVEGAVQTKEQQINTLYDKRVEDARKLAVTNGTINTTLNDQVKAIERARAADLKRYHDAEEARRKAERDHGEVTRFINPVGSGRVTGTFGEQRPGHTHAGIDIAVPVGTPVKAAAGGVIIEAGTLAGYGNVIIIDHGGGTITRYAHLSNIAATKGQQVTQGQVIGASGGARGAAGAGNSQGPHLHFEVRQGGKPVDPRLGKYQTDAVAAAEKAVTLGQEEERRRQTFDNELYSLQGDELKARQALVASAEEIEALETQAIEIARKRYDDNLESLVTQGKLHQDEADQLRDLNDNRAKERTELIKRGAQARQFAIQQADAQRALQLQLGSENAQEEYLRSQEGLAKTASERHDIEQRLIDLQFDEEKLQLQSVIANADRLKIELDRIKTLRGLSELEQKQLDDATAQATLAQQKLDTLPERKGNAQKGNDRQNASPLQSYLQEIPSTAAEINAALEDVAAGGLRSVVDGLTDAIVNFRSLGDVGLAVLRGITAELVRMVLQQIIMRTIGKALGTTAVATASTEAASTAAAWAPAAALASLATLGSNAAPAAAALVATTALSLGLAATGVARAQGGPINGPGGPTDDNIHLAASAGEYVIKARSASKLGRAALDRMNLTGEVPHRASGGSLARIAPVNSAISPSGGGGGARIDEQSLSRLAQIVDAASRAMPPINLYPSIESADVLRAALAKPTGARVMFDFIHENSGRFKAAAAP